MALEQDIDKRLRELLEIEELEEANVTANLDGGEGPVKTPKAFAKSKDEDDLDDEHIEVLGYKKEPAGNRNFEGSEFKRVASQLHLNEVSYKDYKRDDTSTNKTKVNEAIKTINRKLYEIERLVNQNVKLKKEMSVDNGQYWKSTKVRLGKISERILKVAHKFRDLSA